MPVLQDGAGKGDKRRVWKDGLGEKVQTQSEKVTRAALSAPVGALGVQE